jgi:hypothetical protein
MPNLFEAWAEQEKPKWQERLDHRARLKEKKLAAVMAEKRELERRYQAVKAEDREHLLNGPHGTQLGELLAFLDKLTPEGGAELVRHVQALEWLADAPAELRFEALHLLSGAIISLRESQGLPAFDDPLPWGQSRLSVFLKLRELLS